MSNKEYNKRYHTGEFTWKDLKKHPWLFLQEHKKDYKNYAESAIKGIEQPNLLNTVYFSKANMDIIQYRLKKFVFNETWKQSGTHYKIQDQDETKLIVIMKYVYELYAKHLPYKIKEQIDELDDLVIKEAGPETVSEILAHVGYLKHINNPIQPVDRPKNLSSKGTKVLPSITNTFF